MKLDGTGAKIWQKCPLAYDERYNKGIQKNYAVGKLPATSFGKRVHELLENHYRAMAGLPAVPHEPSEDPAVENEAQTMFEGYKAHYPLEAFTVIEVEQLMQVPLGPSPKSFEGHTFTGKVDLIFRDEESGLLWLCDHKTEQRNGKGNLPGAWAARPQVGLYLWAAEKIYKEKFAGILLNILTRQSPKGQKPAHFWRDQLIRTPSQIAEALKDHVWVADQIEQMEVEFEGETWPADRNQCQIGNFRCEFYEIHLYGRDERLIQLTMKPAEKYLDL